MKYIGIALILVLILTLIGCKKSIKIIDNEPINPDRDRYSKFVVNPTVIYQEMESFGASSGWWSQYVGGWDDTREEIMEYLYSKDKGIGLTNYRFNIGAGSKNDNSIRDLWRRSESFEVSPAVYDFSKDENAVWAMRKAVELGVEEIVFFANSPPPRMTLSGSAVGDDEGKSNMNPKMYDEYAIYLLDIVEYFLNEGLPIKYLSPINEPQWDWGKNGSQEGCHFEPNEVVLVYEAVITEINRRGTNILLSGPESGEWGGRATEYIDAMLSSDIVKNHIKTIDVHSYWTNKGTKEQFKKYAETNLKEYSLVMSEWTEMVNGKDFGMDSALNLASEMLTDLEVLEVVSWQYWIAVSKYDYRDGLIYVDEPTHKYKDTKRLWALGNFSRFIETGAHRIDIDTESMILEGLEYIAFQNDNEVIIVVVNDTIFDYDYAVDFIEADYSSVEIHTTSEDYNLEKSFEGSSTSVLTSNKKSISTLVFTKENG